MPIKAVAFDVDGTLYPNLSMYVRSVPFFATHLRLVLAYSRVRAEVRKIRPIEDFKGLERRLLSAHLKVDEREAARLIDVAIHEQWESVLDLVRPRPYLRSEIERMRSNGLVIAVSSDFPVDRKLKRLGLDDLFSCRLWSEESGYLKPHPEPFLELAACIGEEPGTILYVGNNYEYDVLGAKGAGMHAAHLRRYAVPGSVADLTFHDFRQLGKWIERFNRTENHS